MAQDPIRKQPGGAQRPQIWASGGQRPPFGWREALRAAVWLARDGVAPVLAWSARKTRRIALNVKAGAGRIPAAKLGPVASALPSHQRVAAWIANLATTLAHASAAADQDVPRGNALVEAVKPHLWAAPVVPPEPFAPPAPAGPPAAVAPVVLAEPVAPAPDPLASIRGEFVPAQPASDAARPAEAPAGPPAAPGPAAEMAMQVVGALLGWGVALLALPFGLVRALWLWANGRDLKTIGRED